MADWTIAEHAGTAVTLKNPAAAVPALTLIGSTQTSLAGGQTRQVLARKWTLTWTWENIGDTDYAAILAWADGTHGLGPFDVSDPTVDAGEVLLVNVDSFTSNPGPYLGLWSPELVLVQV